MAKFDMKAAWRKHVALQISCGVEPYNYRRYKKIHKLVKKGMKKRLNNEDS